MQWVRQHQSYGNFQPKHPIGNHRAEREIKGQDLFSLSLFRAIHPKAYIDKVRAFVHKRNPVNEPYSPPQVVRTKQRLGLWLKATSTTSDCAYRPINLLKQKKYWERAYLDGVVGEGIRDIINVDECCLQLESTNCNHVTVARE